LPAETLKFPLKTIFAYGPGQPGGGAYENVSGAYCANVAPRNSVSTHGASFGRATSGSAVASFGDPIAPLDV
jgi:hypothetical protein